MSARIRPLVLVTVAMLTLQSAAPVSAQTPPTASADTPTTTKPPAPKPAVVAPKRFASAEEATQALVSAVRADDTKTMLSILGSEARRLVASGDPVADREMRQRFVQWYDAANKLVASGNTTVLHIGADDWPFPIPVIRDGERWRFDVRQGRNEVIARRIGRNELHTMQTCLAYVDAQREYYAEDWNGDGILEYAQQFKSSPNKRDGLYWPTRPGEPPSPLGDLVVSAQAKGYQLAKNVASTPFNGYLFRILTGQGPAAPDGAYDYIVRNHMIAGFGLVAFPAQYGISGVMTFIANHDGIVYQKDLGPTTDTIATAMRRFNPDKTWTKVEVGIP
jgi:DUF2950 family protein